MGVEVTTVVRAAGADAPGHQGVRPERGDRSDPTHLLGSLGTPGRPRAHSPALSGTCPARAPRLVWTHELPVRTPVPPPPDRRHPRGRRCLRQRHARDRRAAAGGPDVRPLDPTDGLGRGRPSPVDRPHGGQRHEPARHPGAQRGRAGVGRRGRGRGGRGGGGVAGAVRRGVPAPVVRRRRRSGEPDRALRAELRQRVLGRHAAGLRRRGRHGVRAVHPTGRRPRPRVHPRGHRAHRGPPLRGPVRGAQRVHVRRVRELPQAAAARPDRARGGLADRAGPVRGGHPGARRCAT